jgi:5-methylthioadenosine/S-adenosylhomocysteine deaminase
MQSYARYRRAGINIALGTDTFPQDMVHDMRQAAVFGKVAETDPRVATAADVFTSATLGGARALGRDDLGRIAVGAKADLVLVDLETLSMGRCVIPSRTSSSVRAATTSTRSWWTVVCSCRAAS